MINNKDFIATDNLRVFIKAMKSNSPESLAFPYGIKVVEDRDLPKNSAMLVAYNRDGTINWKGSVLVENIGEDK